MSGACRHRWHAFVDFEFMAEARACGKSGCGRLEYAYSATDGSDRHWVAGGHRLSQIEVAAKVAEHEMRARRASL